MKKRPTKLRPLPHPLDIALGTRIKTVRQAQRPLVSQQWLGQEIGCSTQQVGKYESGENRLAFSRICEIARALDIGVIEMIRPVVALSG